MREQRKTGMTYNKNIDNLIIRNANFHANQPLFPINKDEETVLKNALFDNAQKGHVEEEDVDVVGEITLNDEIINEIENKSENKPKKKTPFKEKVSDFFKTGFSHVELANSLMKGTTGPKDFLTKQNYTAGVIMTEGFSLETIDDINKSYPEIRYNKEIGFKYTESNLSKEDQKKAREFALNLVSERVIDNFKNLPDYGDVRKYYNEGSLADWIVTHPVNFAAEAISDDYKEFTKNTSGKDGMFTLFNIPTYIEESQKPEENKQKNSKIRQDNYTDILGNVQTIQSIEKNLSDKMDLIIEMKNNIDDPKKFAQLYYQVTDGMNFSPDKVVKYQQNDKETKNAKVPLDSVIGRNYVKEDIKKNDLLTNMFYEVNKSIGTKLLSAVATPAVAGGVNIAVTALEECTQNKTDDINWLKIVLVEGVARPVACGGVAEKVAGKVTSHMNVATGKTGSVITKGIGTVIADDTYNIAEGVANIASGDYGAAAGNAVDMIFHIKSTVKTGFKSIGAK